jgi:hypothetical protein
MSRARRRFIIAYIFLVGVPLLGLAGILKAGRHLSAPVSVSGIWAVTANSNHLSPGPCGESTTLSNLSLSISQSGKNLSLALDGGAKAHGSGTIEGISLQAPLILTRDASAAAGCATAQPLTLFATVDPKSEPRSLSGSLSVDGCMACSPIAFHAVLQPRPKREGGY